MITSTLRRVLPALAAVLLLALLLLIATASGERRAPQLPNWPAPAANIVPLQARAGGLELLPEEGTKLHIHTHLSITLDGHPITVPANIGIDPQRKLYSEIHTHDTSGILHVESARIKTFSLDQLLWEWGLPSEAHTLSSYENGHDGIRLLVYVNGKPRAAGLKHLALVNKDDITIAITSDGSKPQASPRFVWPRGY
jgi:hypothetical protein